MTTAAAGAQLEADLALDELLRGVHEGVDRLPQRAEPVALVDERGPAVLEAPLLLQLGAGEDQVLERAVGLDEDERGRRLVHLPALDADGAVLDHVDPPDPVGAGALVQLGDEVDETELFAVERDRQAARRSR